MFTAVYLTLATEVWRKQKPKSVIYFSRSWRFVGEMTKLSVAYLTVAQRLV